MNRHTPKHPGAMTEAELDHRFVCNLVTFAIGFALTVAFITIMAILSH